MRTLAVFLGYCLLCCSVLAKNSRFYWRGANYAMPWTKGPNICAVQEVQGTRSKYYLECMPYRSRQICGKPTYIRYHCCSGFEKLANERGCTGVKPIENLDATAMHLYLKQFRDYAKKLGLNATLAGEGAYTVFAPHNSAFRHIKQPLRDRIAPKRAGKQSLLLYHLTEDRLFSRDLRNDREIPTLYGDNAPLRINRYSNGIITVNCARIIHPDQEATNGVIHVTDKIMEPIDARRSILTKLRDDGRFGELVTALIVTNLGNELRSGSGPYTFFAPTDQAFKKLEPAVRQRLLKNKKALRELLKYHLMENSICQAAIIKPARLRSAQGELLNVSCDVSDRATVNGAKVIEGDILANNGIIHAIDTVLIPDIAKGVNEVAKDLGLSGFLNITARVTNARLKAILEGQSKRDFTIFVPSNEAFANLTLEKKRTLENQPEALRKVLSYHIVPGRQLSKSFVSEKAYNSYLQARVRVNVYRHSMTVNSARIVSRDHEAGNGVIHVIDKVLFPPEDTMMDFIRTDSRFSKFLALIQAADLQEIFLALDGNYTLFLPTDEAFDALDRSFVEQLMLNPTELRKVLLLHLLPKTIYSSGIQPKLEYRFKSRLGEWLHVFLDHRERILVQGAKILEADLDALNGVVHVIDRVLEIPIDE